MNILSSLRLGKSGRLCATDAKKKDRFGKMFKLKGFGEGLQHLQPL